jgi:hypothetical protein
MVFNIPLNGGKCCICCNDAKDAYAVVMLDVLVPWKFPVWGNVLTGSMGKGIAIVCLKCDSLRPDAEILFVIESANFKMIYHPISWGVDTEGILKCSLTANQ